MPHIIILRSALTEVQQASIVQKYPDIVFPFDISNSRASLLMKS